MTEVKSFLRRHERAIHWAVYALVAAVVAWRLAGPGAHPLTGTAAETFSLSELDGTVFDLSDHLGGKVIVLDFWATWCPPCRKALPVLAEIAREYGDRKVLVVAVNLREPAEIIQQFLKSEDISMQVVRDRYGEAGGLYEVTGLPQTVVIGKDGVISAIEVGVAFNYGGRLRAHIEAAIAEPARAEKGSVPGTQ